MSQQTKAPRPPFLQAVGSDTIRLTRDARRLLQRVTARNGRVAHIPKTRDEAITAHINALPDDLVMRWADFLKKRQDAKVDGTN